MMLEDSPSDSELLGATCADYFSPLPISFSPPRMTSSPVQMPFQQRRPSVVRSIDDEEEEDDDDDDDNVDVILRDRRWRRQRSDSGIQCHEPDATDPIDFCSFRLSAEDFRRTSTESEGYGSPLFHVGRPILHLPLDLPGQSDLADRSALITPNDTVRCVIDAETSPVMCSTRGGSFRGLATSGPLADQVWPSSGTRNNSNPERASSHRPRVQAPTDAASFRSIGTQTQPTFLPALVNDQWRRRAENEVEEQEPGLPLDGADVDGLDDEWDLDDNAFLTEGEEVEQEADARGVLSSRRQGGLPDVVPSMAVDGASPWRCRRTQSVSLPLEHLSVPERFGRYLALTGTDFDEIKRRGATRQNPQLAPAQSVSASCPSNNGGFFAFLRSSLGPRQRRRRSQSASDPVQQPAPPPPPPAQPIIAPPVAQPPAPLPGAAPSFFRFRRIASAPTAAPQPPQ